MCPGGEMSCSVHLMASEGLMNQGKISSQFLNLLWPRGLSRLGGLGFGVIIVGCGEVLIVTERMMQPWKLACGLLNCCLTPAFAKGFNAPGSLLVVWIEVIRVPGAEWVQLQLCIIRQTSWYRVPLSSLLLRKGFSEVYSEWLYSRHWHRNLNLFWKGWSQVTSTS